MGRCLVGQKICLLEIMFAEIWGTASKATLTLASILNTFPG